jgi:predicted Zn-dependent protease with MMP-like domain
MPVGGMIVVDSEEFAAIVEEQYASLPAWVRDYIASGNVAVLIDEERPGQSSTLGLYHSTAGRSEIWIYRRPHVRFAASRAELEQRVYKTLLHEIGHLFGMDEQDLDRYDIGNHPRPGAFRVHSPSPSEESAQGDAEGDPDPDNRSEP